MVGIVGSMFVLSVTGKLPSSAEAAEEVPVPSGNTSSEVVGASITYPEKWSVEREPFTLDETYGFTLWRPDSGQPHDHGGTPAVRVALAYGLEPGQIEATVRKIMRAYPDLPLERETVRVARNGYRGVAVGPIPGSTPSTEVYVPVKGRVYQINVYGEKLDETGKALLSTLHFEPPARPVSSLGLPDANAPKVLDRLSDPELASREQASHKAAAKEDSSPETTFKSSALTQTGETRIAEGCWRADPRFFFQTQHGMYANSAPDDGIPTGRTIVGEPNYWGEYTHGDLGYGRCAEPYNTNDKFAIDYPLNIGDAVFSPFKSGTVTFAGRNITHKDYGIFVTIRANNGKYVSMSAHLSSLEAGIEAGARVDENTIIGYAGDTGGDDIPVGRAHLHQAFYRCPSYNPDGSPYGGAGLQVNYQHYVGAGSGVYRFGWTERPRLKIRGSWTSIKAKGSLISN
jgi:murein DD-endopeptidase MepM/ murein hydrolase activator NlpD